jgi:hypothetical protein
MQSELNSLLASVERSNRHSDFFDDESSDLDEKTLNLNVSQFPKFCLHYFIYTFQGSTHMQRKGFDLATIPSTSNESIAELEVARAASPSTSTRKSRTSLKASESAKKSASVNNRPENKTTLKSIRSRNGREKSAINRVSKNVLKRFRRQCHGKFLI